MAGGATHKTLPTLLRSGHPLASTQRQRELVASDGLLAQLAARGYTVTAP